MSTVAIPATATTSKTSTEADLVRHAARGDAEAFDEVYRRHSQPAWRLAQAVAPDPERAVEAFRAGFVRAVRGHRGGRRSAAEPFRPQVMAAVYRASIDQAYDHSAPTSGPRRAPSAEAALADAAFRSLPERWRAAVWLSEVENLATDRVARVLAVSDAVAAQLVSRGHRGLAGRFAQAHHVVPEHVGEVLRPLTLPMPADLAETTRARWAAAGSDRTAVMAPLGGWLAERGARPMAVTAGALLGLGLIGLGLVPGGSSVRATLGAATGGSGAGAVPVHTCDGLTCPAAPGTASTAGAVAGGGLYGSNAAYMSALSGAGGGGASGGYGYGGGYIGGSGGGLTPGGGGSGTALGGAGGSATGGSSTTGSGGGTTGAGGGSGGGTTPPSGGTTTILPLAPVASVTQTGGTYSVNLLPSGSGSTATVSGGSGGAGATVGGTTVLSTTTTTVAPTTTTTTVPLLNTVTSTVGGLTGTSSSTTTTTLLGGL